VTRKWQKKNNYSSLKFQFFCNKLLENVLFIETFSSKNSNMTPFLETLIDKIEILNTNNFF